MQKLFGVPGRRLAGAVAVVGLIALTSSAAPAAWADVPAAQGWWSTLNRTPLSVPAPSQVPTDGLYVAGVRGNATDISAVQLNDSVPGVLALALAPGQKATGAVLAVPATSKWKPEQDGAWSDAPSHATSPAVVGQPSPDGSTIVFHLPASFPTTDGVIDVVLVPASTSVVTSVAFARPSGSTYAPDTTTLAPTNGLTVPSGSVVQPAGWPSSSLAAGPATVPSSASAQAPPAPPTPPSGPVSAFPHLGRLQGGAGRAVPRHFQIPFAVLVLGAITGMTYGLLAVGLVLVYRSSRIINFAHGQIGAFAAAVFGLAVLQWHLPYWVALPLALVFAGGVGSATEAVVIRRLRKAPIIMSVVATLGLGSFLAVFALVVNSGVAAGRFFPQPPFLPQFDIGPLRVTTSYSAMLIMTPLLVAGLALFLRRSRTGIAIRAAAANPDAARLAGVSISRMSSLSWAVAGAVAAFTAILVLPTQGFANPEFLGPGLLLRALAAAVIASMASLPVALLAGIGIGVVEQILLWNYPQGGLVETVLFGVILVILLVQRRRAVGRLADMGSWAAVQPWPPVPDNLRKLWPVRHLGKILAAVLFGLALLVPVLASNATSFNFVVVVSFALVGLSVGIVTGLGGQLSLGQFALAGVGALVSYVVSLHTGNFLLSFLCAGLAAAAVSLVIGLPALRIRGLLLAVTTLGFALACQDYLFGQSWFFGQGTNPGQPILGRIVFDTGKSYYLLSLVPFAAALWLAHNVWRGGLGRRLRAVRDNEAAARAFTVRATWVKLQGFLIAGFLAGIGGALYGHSLSSLSASAFPLQASIEVTAMAVLGGLGLLAGPVIGAFYIVGLPLFVSLGNAGLAASSLGWLALILYYPGGIAQAVQPLRQAAIRALARLAGAASDLQDPASEPLRAPVVLTRQPSTESPVGSASTGVTPVLLSVRDLSKRFGGVRAVDHVDLDVHPGEIVGLIGPNGAGKTTLFELIGGFARPDGGTVTFAGKDVTRLGPEARARSGLVRSFQDAALFPTMTVLDTVLLALERCHPTRAGAALVGLDRAERHRQRRARELVSMMGLSAFRDKQISELSTGTRRITELACLIALQPIMLLLDEPASGVAQRETEALGDVLLQLRELLGLTLVVIEHDIPMVMRLAHRIVAMESGRIIADGSPAEVREDARVVEAYLGLDDIAIDRSGASHLTSLVSTGGGGV